MTESGGVKCWGKGAHGRLGNNTVVDSNDPVDVVGIGGTGTLGNIVQISSGSEHACALNSDGQVMCWGRGLHGRLGNSAVVDSNYPVNVVGTGGTGTLGNIVQISSSGDHTCATASNGQVMCWGRGANGRLGNNAVVNSNYPVDVVGTGGTGNLGEYCSSELRLRA